MGISRFFAACAGASLLLSGCALDDGALIPSLAGEREPDVAPTSLTPTSAEVETFKLEPVGVTPAPSTGTFVGKKVEDLRGDLARLQAEVQADAKRLQALHAQSAQTAQGYHRNIAAISAKLQVGTTQGNPILVQKWNEAQAQLEQVSRNLAEMNSLANKVAAKGAMASYLLEGTQAAFGLSGAVDEDHRQLGVLEDEVNRTVVMIDRLLDQLTDDVERQTAYLATERSNLTALALAISKGEIYGPSLASRAYAAPTTPVAAPPGAGVATGRPLVVIRFDSDDVDYERALFDAISRALDRRPSAAFDLVAVARGSGTPAEAALNATNARRNAENVLRSLTRMGLPPERVSLSAKTSRTVQSNEVQIYVR